MLVISRSVAPVADTAAADYTTRPSADLDLALDAVRSLRVSSATVGADELAGLAGLIETALGRADFVSARTHAALLAEAASRAEREIAAYLGA